MKTKVLFGIGCLFFIQTITAQPHTTYNAETFGSVATGEHTPFWMVNHKWGTVDLAANNFYLRGGVFHEQKLNKDWSFDAGIDVVAGNRTYDRDAWIQQLYGRVNLKVFRIDVGTREDYRSLVDPQLSSGSLNRSNHARPLPQIQAGMPEFWLVPFTRGLFFLKGELSVGKYIDGQWQENFAKPHLQSYEKNVLSHHKAIYFRFGDIQHRHKQQFTISMFHESQWGGYFYEIRLDENYKRYYKETNKRHNFRDFAYVLVAKGGEGTANEMDASFISGSHLGHYTFKYDYKWSENTIVSAYLQHIFEDGTSMGFFNYPDNLYGLAFRSSKKQIVSGAVLECLYSKQQSGPIHLTLVMDDVHRAELQFYGGGNDNYYNNAEYKQGYSHFGRTLGTPFFLSPEYNADGSLTFHNNRVIAFHVGLEGYLHNSLQYRLLLSQGQGWGRFFRPFINVQKGFASQLEIIYNCPKFNGLSAKLALGYDNGAFFGGDTFGCGLTLSKTGLIR